LTDSLKHNYGQTLDRQIIDLQTSLKRRLLRSFGITNIKDYRVSEKTDRFDPFPVQAANINIFGLMYKEHEDLFQIIYDMHDSSHEPTLRAVLWTLSRMILPPTSESNDKITRILKSVITNPMQYTPDTRKLAISCLIQHFLVQGWRTDNVVGEIRQITTQLFQQDKQDANGFAAYIESLLPFPHKFSMSKI